MRFRQTDCGGLPVPRKKSQFAAALCRGVRNAALPRSFAEVFAAAPCRGFLPQFLRRFMQRRLQRHLQQNFAAGNSGERQKLGDIGIRAKKRNAERSNEKTSRPPGKAPCAIGRPDAARRQNKFACSPKDDLRASSAMCEKLLSAKPSTIRRLASGKSRPRLLI